MDKLIYLFLLLILFISSINTNFLLLGIVLFMGLCLYYKEKQLLIIGLIILYGLSLAHTKQEEFSSTNREDFDTTKTNQNNKLLGKINEIKNELKELTEEPLGADQPLDDDEERDDTITIKDKYDEVSINPTNYSKIFFVLSSLLDKKYLQNNKESIEKVMDDYSITDIYILGDAVLNVNNDKKYNNFLEKITCLKKDGNVDYLDCNINYKKIKAFSELIRIYTFSIEYVLKLINSNKIYELCDIENHITKLINDSQFGYEYNGYMVYVNKLSVHNKYFRLIELLGLDKKLTNQNTKIPFKERLYNYVDKNKKVSKDLNSISVLFDYYKILDDIRINNEEDDYDWDYSLLRNIDLNMNYWNDNPFFKEYKIKTLIIDKINELTKEDKNIFKHELNNKYKNKNDNINKKINKEESKIIKKEENKLEHSGEFLEKLNLENIRTNFTKVFIEIIDDVSELYKERCARDCKDEDNFFNTFNYYFNNTIKIIVKEGRMFYIGIFIIFISIMLYFIESTK